jgi:hypothetical protein
MTVSCIRRRKVPVIPKLDLHHLATELKEGEKNRHYHVGSKQ